MRIIPYEGEGRQEVITSFKTDPKGKGKKVIKRKEIKKKGLKKAVKDYRP